MDCIRKHFAFEGLEVCYERFVQLQVGAAITVPTADAVCVTTKSQISLLIVPNVLGATPYSVLVNSLFVLDDPFASITISDVDGTVPVVRVTGFAMQQTQES